jgi:hypothetical protein
LRAVAGSSGTPLKPEPFFVAIDWLKYFITQNKDFDWTTMTPAAYQRYWDQSDEQYGSVIGTDNPDLTAFRDRGGKTIIWHGWADELITARELDPLLQTRAGADGRTEEDCGVRAPLSRAGSVALRGRSRTAADRRRRRAGQVGRRRQDARRVAADPLRSNDGRGDTFASALPVPARREVQGSGSTDEATNFVCSSGF